MSTPNLDTLREQAAQITEQYNRVFAGQPRYDRDPALLEGMVEALDEIIESSQGFLDEEPWRESLRESRALYENEAMAIRQAQAQGPEVIAALAQGDWVEFVGGAYRRNFAGKSRATRDASLLDEYVAELDRTLGVLSTVDIAGVSMVSDIHSLAQKNRELYTRERAAIGAARGAGTLAEQGDILAAVANEQFSLYKAQFAGKQRLSRPPWVLRRISTLLDNVLERMSALQAQGLTAESNFKNIGIVKERLKFYRGEVEAIQKNREETTFDELVNALGKAANDIFAVYNSQFAGQDRKTRSLSTLGELCDGLFDLARQMRDLDDVQESEANQHNLRVVVERLRLYQREYQFVEKASSGS